MENRFTTVFEKDGDWWIGYVEVLPGANTQGRTLDEVRENLCDAVSLIREANRELLSAGLRKRATPAPGTPVEGWGGGHV